MYITTPTESQIYAAVRSWLIEVLPGINANNIVQGQLNRVAAPTDPFVTMLIIDRRRLATNGWTYDKETSRTIVDKTQITMQINVFGAATSNYMQAITTLWRDMSAVDFFDALNIDLTPLFTSDVRQAGFITSERQYDDQWTVDLEMQANFTLSLPQQFATEIDVTLFEIDAAYPIPQAVLGSFILGTDTLAIVSGTG